MDVTAQLRRFVKDVAVGQTKRQTEDGHFINLAQVLQTDVSYDDSHGNDNILNSKFLTKSKKTKETTHKTKTKKTVTKQQPQQMQEHFSWMSMLQCSSVSEKSVDLKKTHYTGQGQTFCMWMQSTVKMM